MTERLKCPATNEKCKYYGYILDDNDEIKMCMCGHAGNHNHSSGNCTWKLCPIKKKSKENVA